MKVDLMIVASSDNSLCGLPSLAFGYDEGVVLGVGVVCGLSWLELLSRCSVM